MPIHIIKKNKIILFAMLFGLMFSSLLSFSAYAETPQTPSNNGIFTETKDLSDPGLPSASSEQVANYAERKGFEVVNILQRFAEPFMIIIFIVGAFIFLLGLATGPMYLKDSPKSLIPIVPALPLELKGLPPALNP